MKNAFTHGSLLLKGFIGTWRKRFRDYVNHCLTSGYMPRTFRPLQIAGRHLATLWMFLQVGRIRVIGAENLRAEGRIIFCPNHSSMFDAPIIFSLMQRMPRYMTAIEEMRGLGGLKAIVMGAFGCFAVDRSKGKSVLEPAIQVLSHTETTTESRLLRWLFAFLVGMLCGFVIAPIVALVAGWKLALLTLAFIAIAAGVFVGITLSETSGEPTLVIFPEGKISPTGEYLPFKKGASIIAIGAWEKLGRKEKVGIVPIHICFHKRDPETAGGSYGAMGLSWRAGATVRIGKPIYVHEVAQLAPETLTDRVRTGITEQACPTTSLPKAG